MWVPPEEKRRYQKARSGAGVLGVGLGGAGGALLGQHFGGTRGALAGAGLGALLGGVGARELAVAHLDDKTVKRYQQVADRERAQEHRKELLDVKDTMKKKEASTLHGVMYAAMANELAAIEKTAVNITPIVEGAKTLFSKAMPAVKAVTSKALPVMEGVGGKIVGGISKVAPSVAGHVERAAGAVGGMQNLHRIAGGTALGVGALGTLGAAHHFLKRPQQPQVVIQR